MHQASNFSNIGQSANTIIVTNRGGQSNRKKVICDYSTRFALVCKEPKLKASFSCPNFFCFEQKGVTDWDWYDPLAFFWTLGYVTMEVQMMFKLASTVQDPSCLSMKKLHCFFANTFLNFQLLSHCILLMGMSLKVIDNQSVDFKAQ